MVTTPADHEGPCPHCGDAGETGCNDDGKAVWYQCNVCGMRGPRVRMTQRASADDLFALALAGWNRLSGLRTDRDQLIGFIDEYCGVMPEWVYEEFKKLGITKGDEQ